jgi:hypothetical protein
MSSQPNISTSSEHAGSSSRSRLPVQHKNSDDDVVDQQSTSPANPRPSASPSGKKISDVAAAAPTVLPFKLSLTLQNTGSVARDHLASERTFLAYVRTSLSFASAGVGASLPPPQVTVAFFGAHRTHTSARTAIPRLREHKFDQ